MYKTLNTFVPIAAILACSLLVACDGGETTNVAAANGPKSIPAGFGKGDNYIGTGAKEFVLTATLESPLENTFADLTEDEQAAVLTSLRDVQLGDVARATTRGIEAILAEKNKELEEKFRSENPDADIDDLVKYFIYVKPSYQGGTAELPVVVDNTALFDVKMEMVGSLDLIELLDGDSADQSFDIDIDGEAVSIGIEVSPSTDAFPRYDVLFEDGVYDIAIIFGGDYNEERYDIETATWTVTYLLENGWKNPEVTSFEDLKYDSPPFTQELLVEGRTVEAQVYIIHSNMDDDAGKPQSLLRELVEDSVKQRDVIIYSGHAGTNAGMILDYQPRYEIDDTEFKDLTMRDDYQIWVFDGCNSYRTYVDALLENPARSYETTDVVTTVNTTPFSAGYEIINRFVHWLTFTTNTGAHFPMSWNTILRGINFDYPDVYYGVHGVDNSPKLNPHASEGIMCQACDADADCGAGGNSCLAYNGGSACGVACTDAAACGDGFDCIALDDDPELFYIPKQCVKTNMRCN